MTKIAIVNSSSFGNVFPEHLAEINSFAETTILKVDKFIKPEDFIPALKDFDGIIASTNPDYPRELLKNLPKLKIIARHGIGFNNVDIKAAEELGIIVTKVKGPVERNSVAEHNLALLLSAARWTPQGNLAVRNDSWKDRARFIGKELTNKTVGIIGLGNIGSRSAEIIHRGFNATILVFDPTANSERIAEFGYKKVELDQLLSGSDFICLHCAHTESSHKILNKNSFEKMKDGVIIVNTARGELVDDLAIIDFLNSGKVAAYATDVIDGEPIDGSHPLLAVENAIVVPHLGGYSEESLRGMGETMLNNLKSVFVKQEVPRDDLVPGLKIDSLRESQDC